MYNFCQKVSIGIPVYNAEKYIERCAVSLFEQTYPNIEYVFVDDASPDSSIDILENVILRYANQKPNVKLVRNATNLGSATTRNIILDNCTGEFLLWVDSDDFVELDTVHRLIELQQQNNCDILGFGAIKHSQNRTFSYMPYLFFTPQDMFLSIMERKTHNALWGRLIRRSLFVKNNIRFVEGQNVGEDFYVVVLLSYYAKSVFSVEDVLYHYDCINSMSLMSSFSVEKAMMTWYNIETAKSFFNGKGLFYENAFKKKEAKTIVSQMVSCYSSAENCIEFFKYLKNRASNLEIKDLQGIEFSKKLIYLIPSYRLARSCCRIMKTIKNHLIKFE